MVPPLQSCLPRLAPCTGTTLVSFLSCRCTLISPASGSSRLRFLLCGPFPRQTPKLTLSYLPSDTFTLRGSGPLSSTALVASTKEVTKQLFVQLFVQCIPFSWQNISFMKESTCSSSPKPQRLAELADGIAQLAALKNICMNKKKKEKNICMNG